MNDQTFTIGNKEYPLFLKEWLREIPLSKEDLLEFRKLQNLRNEELIDTSNIKYTCDDCEDVDVCTLAFDPYNTSGDCLLDK